MFKFISFAALVAVARAGFIGSPDSFAVNYNPYNAAVSAPLAIHAPAIGSSQQSVVRSLDGNSAVSHYSKAVDTAFSSVRKYDTRVTNDAKYLQYAAAPALYHAPAPAVYTAAAAPASTYYAAASPIVKTVASAPAYYAAPSPIVKTVAPAYYAASSPIVKTVAPAYAPASAYYAAPSPIVKTVAPAYAPVVAHTTFTGFGASYAF
ncbi:cuticle protein LPCP-23-like [Leptopilina heterotoma]|uniref:cuticle protein LPCP-23-like n=1 Tax=Leptopilina heterotoma TaxID=63436 RepID=UPI001CA8F58F|nr:cuticle protein LPCP-23-like [Leptopilina heterotoma]